MSGLLIGILLVVCVGLFAGYRIKHNECEDLKQCRASDFMQFNITKEQLFASQKEAGELRAELSERPLPAQAEEEPQEQGNFVKRRTMKRATPETYRNVFDLDLNGQRVLEHLTMVFCKEAFVSNDKGGERETCHRLGQQSVINFIVNTINQANNPNYKEQVND